MRVVTSLLIAAAALVAAGCSTSPAALQKAAQANADKYYELLKAGQPEAAYNTILSKSFKSNFSLDQFLMLRGGIDRKLGPLVDYQIENAKIEEGNNRVTMTYLLRTAHVQEPWRETVRFRLEGTEWRMDEFEPQFKPPKPDAPPPTPAPG